MSKARDVEVTSPGIVPKEHSVRLNTPTKRAAYPFKAMIVGDYFRVYTAQDAHRVRVSLRDFYRTVVGRRFTVRLRDDNEWVCRRIR